MSVLIVVTNIVVRVVYEWGTKALRNRTSQWQKISEKGDGLNENRSSYF